MGIVTQFQSLLLVFFILVYPFLLQHGVPAFTVSQPDEAMSVLQEKASQLGVSCMVLFPYYLEYARLWTWLDYNNWLATIIMKIMGICFWNIKHKWNSLVCWSTLKIQYHQENLHSNQKTRQLTVTQDVGTPIRTQIWY